ncbi:MAG: hypothetical protein MZV64_42540 [Ignavibacteriales bacterium]|nr:hypothetical protein [Ignavibacteriales bacterium]
MRPPPSTSSNTNPCRTRARSGRCRTCIITPRRRIPGGLLGSRHGAASPRTSAAISTAKPWRTSSTNGPDTERTGVRGRPKGRGCLIRALTQGRKWFSVNTFAHESPRTRQRPGRHSGRTAVLSGRTVRPARPPPALCGRRLSGVFDARLR